MPIRSGGKVVLIAPGSKEVVLVDPSRAAAEIAKGYQPATAEDVAKHNQTERYGTAGQQAQATAESAVRGATLGLVEGFGSDEGNRARASVLAEESPVVSAVSEFVPDIAAGVLTGGASALATGAGRLAAKGAIKAGARSALTSAVKAAPKAAIAGEALGAGLVAASQEAYSEGRSFLDDPVEDAQNVLFWAGLGGTIGGAPSAFRAARGSLRKGAKAAAALADEADLAAARRAGEDSVSVGSAPGSVVGGSLVDPLEGGDSLGRTGGSSKTGQVQADVLAHGDVSASPVSLVGKDLTDLGALPFDEATDRASTLAGLRGSDEFAASGRAPKAFDRAGHEQGITVVIDSDGSAVLRDGRHRFSVAKEKDLETVWGTVIDGQTGEQLYRGDIPLRAPKAPRGGPPSQAAQHAAERSGVGRAERAATQADVDDVIDRVTRGKEPVSEAGGFARDSRLAQYQTEIMDTATREAREKLNELNRVSQGIRERAVKQEDVAKNVSDNVPAQQAKARELVLRAQKFAGEMTAEARKLGGWKSSTGKAKPVFFSGSARSLTSSLIERGQAISKMTSGPEIFNALDDLKRVVDDHKVALEQGARVSKDPMAYQQLIPRVQDYADQIRRTLEDSTTFGRAGEMQAAYNKTFHEKWFPAKKVFEESVFKVTGKDYRAFDTLDAWEGKVTNLLATPNSGERRYAMDMLEALNEMAEQRAKFGTSSAKETGRVMELVKDLKKTFALADETTAAASRMQNVRSIATGFGTAVGAFGGLPGAMIGGAVAKGVGEAATGRLRNAFRGMKTATENEIGRSVDDWIRSSRVRAGAKLPSVSMPRLRLEDRQLLATAKRRGATMGFSEFLGDDDNPQSAYAVKRDALLDDEAFVERFSDDFGDMVDEEPTVYALAAGKAAEVRKFLVDRLPANMAISMMRPNGYPPTNESIEDWSVYWNAATNPRSVFRSLARGDIRPQEVETLQTLYRPMYEQMQFQVDQKIRDAAEAGEELDDQFVMKMNLLFELDGAGSPAFSQRAAQIARSAAPPSPANGAQPGRSLAPKAQSRVQPANAALTGPTYGTMPG
jgi:hypothetical protein